ncbi:MAG: 4Fe-4S binding protein [Bacillota bacterium]
MAQSSIEQIIKDFVVDFVAQNPANSMSAHGGMKIYDKPLIAFASADDPLFEQLKEPDIVWTEHISPGEWLDQSKSVISYFMPFTKNIRESNRAEGLPSEEWVSSRIDGEAFNDMMRAALEDQVKKLGWRGVAPVIDSRFKMDLKVGFRSNWSERHVAYIAGLGTFGLHRNLITARGCTGRFGSVVTTLALTPTQRPYTRHDEYCPWLVKGECGACIDRCPVDAIPTNDKGKALCNYQMFNVVQPIFKPRLGCAKCQITVPCETGIPT